MAPLVFVGYGLTIPEKNYEDLAGLDLKLRDGHRSQVQNYGIVGQTLWVFT